MQAPPGVVGWLIVDDHGRHALRLDEAGAMQYAAERHGVVWPLAVWHDPGAGPAFIEARPPQHERAPARRAPGPAPRPAVGIRVGTRRATARNPAPRQRFSAPSNPSAAVARASSSSAQGIASPSRFTQYQRAGIISASIASAPISSAYRAVTGEWPR